MRDYGKVAPTFWTGETGRDLRKASKDAQLVALYLLTCGSSHMSGIYYLALPTLCHELGLTIRGASKALQRVEKTGFAYFDAPSEVVFVPEMARFQIGERLEPKDNRHKGLIKYLENYRKSLFYKDFYTRYKVSFSLPEPSPFEAPCKGRVRTRAEQEQEQEKEQELEQDQEKEKEQEQETYCGEPSETASPPNAVFIFPTVGKEPHEYPLLESKVAEYQETFPGLNVIAELRKALQWCKDRPTNRKTNAGMPKFLFGWLSRTQDRGGSKGNADPRGTIAAMQGYLALKESEANE
jgi:hypothetical protein